MEIMRRGARSLRWTLPAVLAVAALGQQYKADQAGPPPTEASAGITAALDKPGFQISRDGAAYCEIWLRAHLPEPNLLEPSLPEPSARDKEGAGRNITLPQLRPGTLLGVIRFDGQGADRRGQTIQPGVYTLRYAVMPMNGSHEGASPHRDFLVLSPASEDRNLDAAPSLDALAAMSRKASRTAHPAILSLWKADADSPGFSQQNDTDWVLESKIGDTAVAIIVAGAAGN
jgi:hypothetical protein